MIGVFSLLLSHVAFFSALLLLPPAVFAIIQDENTISAYLISLAIAAVAGLKLRLFGSAQVRNISLYEGAGVIFAGVVLMAALGMLPFFLTDSAADLATAFFAAMSCVTSTGFAILPKDAPESIALYQALLSWGGTLNFIVIMVSLLPQVSGCFGVTLSARQTAFFSPVWNKMEQSARQGGAVFLVFTVISLILFLLSGTDFLTAVKYALLTVSTTGGDFTLNTGERFAAFFAMLLGSLNFILVYKLYQRRELKLLVKDSELSLLGAIIFLGSILVAFHLWRYEFGLDAALGEGFFEVMSFVSTTGMAAGEAAVLPDFEKYLLFLLSFVGGSIGSAAGGMKLMRLMVLLKGANLEISRTLHQRMVTVVKLYDMPVPAKIQGRLLSFFFLQIIIFAAASLILAVYDLNFMRAMAVSAACLFTNGGTALLFSVDAASLSGFAKMFCALLMLVGRMEVFSFLVLIYLAVTSQRNNWKKKAHGGTLVE